MYAFKKLLTIMAQLRDPKMGCPWDRQQTFTSIVPFTIEEVYEVADAIEQQDYEGLKQELGDLLFQIVFYAQIAKENDLFNFTDVAEAINEKMIRRHPHVFADVKYSDMDEHEAAWERIKAGEKKSTEETSILDDVPRALPALMRAFKLQRKAAKAGFDWSDLAPVLDKLQEEIEEVRAELVQSSEKSRLQEEVGDVLFACVNLARYLKVDPETALRKSNDKFESRIRKIESWLRQTNRNSLQASPEELDNLWEKAKAEEKNSL